MISWILSFIPTWVWVLGAIVLAVATMNIWLPIWKLLPLNVRLILAGVGATIVGIMWGRSRGRLDARQEQAKRDAEANKRRLETNDEIRRLSDPQRKKERERWERD